MYRPLADDVEALRGRRASANRCLAQLKAALTRAWRYGKTPSYLAWRKVKRFAGAVAAGVR
jgi:hypothetical protein